MPKKLILLLTAAFLQSCFLFNKPTPPKDENSLPEFIGMPDIYPVTPGQIDEASGMVDGKINDGLWVIEDSDTKAGIDLISHEGAYIRKVDFNGVNRDWEDIATGPGPQDNVNYIYISETGDNNEVYGQYYIYRFPEPAPGQTLVSEYDKITFTYSDNKSYDAETLLLDPLTKDLYVITKRQFNVNVFRLAYPQSTDKPMVAQFLQTIRYPFLTGGDISADGKEILLKGYDAIYYWKRRDGESVIQTLSRDRDIGAPYLKEPQGESVCFDQEGKGYYTISELADAPYVNLYYYRKKK